MLSTVVGIVLLFTITIPQFGSLPMQQIARLFPPVSTEMLAACQQDPSQWSVHREQSQMFAYDPETLLITDTAPLFAMFLAVMLAVRPLLARIERISAAAMKVGSDAYTPINTPIHDALGRLAGALDNAHHRQRQATQALEQHLDDGAHDLRTPLAALQLRLEAAANQSESLRPELNAGLADVMYLTLLTENLRVAVHLRDGQTPASRHRVVDLVEVIQRIAERFRLLGQRRGVEVVYALPETPVWVHCPAVLAEQAFANLVHHAIVHNHPGGHVALVVELEADSRFTVSIIDDGPGVDIQDFPRLMKRAFRADSARQRDPRGSGLGLAIAGEVFRRAQFTVQFSTEMPSGLRIDVSGQWLSA